MAHTDDCNCPPCRYRRGQDLGQTPRLTVRLRPDVRDFLLNHSEGARGVIERLVDQEKQGHHQVDDRVRTLESQLAKLQAQLAAAQIVGATAQPTQVSDNSQSNRLENYAARFREGYKKTIPARSLARRLGQISAGEVEALQVGYCGSRGAARDGVEQKELQKLGLANKDRREILSGSLTIPLFGPTGELTGFWGYRLKPGQGAPERKTGSGLLPTGPLGAELVLVESVVEALAAYGGGTTGVQAMELLTEGWLPTLAQKRVGKVWLALSRTESSERVARELMRLGVECFWVKVPESQESRIDLLEYRPSWEIQLRQARRATLKEGKALKKG